MSTMLHYIGNPNLYICKMCMQLVHEAKGMITDLSNMRSTLMEQQRQLMIKNQEYEDKMNQLEKMRMEYWQKCEEKRKE